MIFTLIDLKTFHDSNSLFTHCLRSNKKTAAYAEAKVAVIEAWTSLGLNQGPPDYETNRMIVRDIPLL